MSAILGISQLEDAIADLRERLRHHWEVRTWEDAYSKARIRREQYPDLPSENEE